MKYKSAIHKWQKKEFGKLSSIIPILFYQGLDNWEHEIEQEEVRKLKNPILSGIKKEILFFDLRKIEQLKDFANPGLRAGILVLKIILEPWEDFIIGCYTIREILNSMEESKRIDLEEDMLDYIFRSMVRQAHQPN